jgi:fibronectin-binding autotransporter adhesin
LRHSGWKYTLIATEVALFAPSFVCYDRGMLKTNYPLVCEDLQRSISSIGTDRSPCVGLILVRLRMLSRSHRRSSHASLQTETINPLNRMKNFFKTQTALAITTLAIVQSTYAGSHTWSGANGTLFNNPGNWSYGGVPTNGEQNVYLYFPAGATHYSCSNNIVGLTVTGIGISGDNYGLIGNPINCASGAYITVSGTMDWIANPMQLSGNDLTFNISSNVTFYGGPITGTGNVIKAGTGVLRFNNSDPISYTGTTYVNFGTLELAAGNGLHNTIPGPFVVGTGSGSPGTAIVKYLSDGQVFTNSTVTVNYTGLINLNGYTESLNAGLTMAGGSIQTGSGSLRMFCNTTVQSGTSAIYGNLWLYTTNRIYNAMAGGTLNIYANMPSYIYEPGLIKIGPGAVNLYGSNTYTGPTIVSQGYLGLGNPNALGSKNLTITNSGIVQLYGIGLTNITASISGNGNGNGALRAFGTNVFQGLINLGANAGIQALAANDLLTLDATIFGPGGLIKSGAGKVILGGYANNMYQGTTTVVDGTLELSKSNSIAIPAAIIIGDSTNAPSSRVVRLTAGGQIYDQADVTINASGLLELGATVGIGDVVGSLAGAGHVNLGWDSLSAGANNATTQFGGSFSGGGLSKFIKQGTGTMSINGNSPSWVGATVVQGGTVSINGSLPNSPVTVAAGATLAGNGVTGPIYSNSGKVTPGNSAGLLYSANLTLNSNSVLEVELNGTNVGVDYDQISVTGTVELGNATLTVLPGFSGAVGNQFMIIKNDSSDSVAGTFNGLAEGATMLVGGTQYQVSYKGGDGNDVVLTQTAVAQPPKLGGLTAMPNGQIQLQGTGFPGSVYGVEANTNLSTTNWIAIGYSIADQQGGISFTDTNAPNYSMRFYRLIVK